MLGEARTYVNNQIDNVQSVRQIDIHNRDAIEQSTRHYPNVNKLMLDADFDLSRGTITNDFNRVIPLRQLTHLTLQCHRLQFEKLLEILRYTQHIHTLELHSTIIYPTGSNFVQENAHFQLISHTNLVTHLMIEKEITLDRLQYFSALFPRLESLTINFYEEALEPIIFFLLSKANKNTRHLSNLCISKRASTFMKKIHNVIKLKNLLQYYSSTQINQKLYLWW